MSFDDEDTTRRNECETLPVTLLNCVRLKQKNDSG